MRRSVRILALITEGFGGYGGISQYNRDFLTALSHVGPVAEIVVLSRLGDATKETLPSRIRQEVPIGKITYAARAIAAVAMQPPFNLVFCGHISLSPLAAVIAR